MSKIIVALREGDIYRWSYRRKDVDLRSYGTYHCCSCIAIVRHGRLRDTYWQIGTSFNDGRSFGIEDMPQLELIRIANLDDLNKAPEYQDDYYDDADIVDLNHPNSSRGNFYLRKGAVRSVAKMLQVSRERLAEAESDLRTATDRVKEMHEIIAKLENGDALIPYIPSWRG